jgi:hypothetical protein
MARVKASGKQSTRLAREGTVRPKVDREQPHAPPARGVPEWLKVLPPVAFFLTYFLCLWKWVNVMLMYHGGGLVRDFPSFYWGWEFARQFWTHPGGLVEYASALIAQGLYSSWYGALVLTLQAVLVCVSFAGLPRAIGGKVLRWIGLIPPLLFLVLYSKYRHYSGPVSSFAAGSVLVWGYAQFGRLKPLVRLSVGLVQVGCLYAAAPSGLFVLLPGVVLCELKLARFSIGLALFLALSALVPWTVGKVLFGFAAGESYEKLLPLGVTPDAWNMRGAAVVAILFCFPALLCVGLLVAQNVLRSSDGPVKNFLGQPAFAWFSAGLLGAVLLPVTVVFLAHNSQAKAFITVDYLAWHGRWAEVLAATKGYPGNPYMDCTVAQATYHTGGLTQKLPQLLSPSDLLLFNDKQVSHWKKSDLYFDLGYLNMSLHHLTESMEFFGERPVLLQRLALVNLALGNISTAEVYLRTLARAPFQSAWARDYLERVKRDPKLAGDESVDRLRNLKVMSDSVVSLTLDQELIMLLRANPRNRMAFEYLMTYYLLAKNLNGFVANIARVKDFPGFEVSLLWDEALVMASRFGGRPIEVPDHAISPSAVSRVDAVASSVKNYAGELEQARRDLRPNFGDTYAFYYWCAPKP